MPEEKGNNGRKQKSEDEAVSDLSYTYPKLVLH